MYIRTSRENDLSLSHFSPGGSSRISWDKEEFWPTVGSFLSGCVHWEKAFLSYLSFWQFIDIGKINNYSVLEKGGGVQATCKRCSILMPFLNSFEQEYPSVPPDFNMPLVRSLSTLFEGRLKNTCPGTVLGQFFFFF